MPGLAPGSGISFCAMLRASSTLAEAGKAAALPAGCSVLPAPMYSSVARLARSNTVTGSRSDRLTVETAALWLLHGLQIAGMKHPCNIQNPN